MAEPVMCCGGTCVRALCEYHKDVPLEPVEPEPPTEPSPAVQYTVVRANGWSYYYDAGKGIWMMLP